MMGKYFRTSMDLNRLSSINFCNTKIGYAIDDGASRDLPRFAQSRRIRLAAQRTASWGYLRVTVSK